MRVLVLGGRGFIGGHVVRALDLAGHQIRVFGRAATGLQPDVPGVDYRTGDLADADALGDALQGVEVVYHLISTTVPLSAEADPVADVQGNLVGTLGLLAEMRRQGIRRLVYLSSGGAVYGVPDALPIPEVHPLRPIGSYGIVKQAIEAYLTHETGHGLQPVVLRPANVYGPFQSRPGVLGFVTTALHRLATGVPLTLYGDGSIVRDYLHVNDLADLCLRTLSAEGPVTVNAGSGEGHSLNQVIALIEEVTGRKVPVIHKPARAVDVPVSVLDIRRAGHVFDWQPKITLRQGIAETWDWVRAQVSR